jgi:hypothetical protein
MAGGAKVSYAIPVITLSFKLLLLGIIIFVALTYIPQGQPTQSKALIAIATVFVYGTSDFILRKLMDTVCDCDNHRS